MPLLVWFLFVCVAEVVIGALLWSRHPAGVLLSVLLLPVEMVFWIGFALPLGPPLGVTRTGLCRCRWAHAAQATSDPLTVKGSSRIR